MSPKLMPPPREAPAKRVEETLPPPGTGLRDRRDRGYRRAVLVGLGVSLLFHLLVLLFVGRWIEIGARRLPSPPVSVPEREGLEVVRMREVPPPPQPEEEPPPEREEAPPPRPIERRPEETEVVRPAPVREPAEEGEEAEAVGAPEAEEAEEALTNAERLQPRVGDERLWVDFRDPLRVGGERAAAYARADSALRTILRGWLDSLQLTDEQRRRAMDWTFGEDGNRWGISSEGLHLGDITIPIPFGQLFQQGGPKGREARQALQDLMEIRQQDVRDDQERVMKERREEMRRRSREEAEKGEASRDTTSGG